MNLILTICPVCVSTHLDGAGEHRGDAGHVVGDGHHLLVSPDGDGGRAGLLQLAQLQRDRGREEHVLRRPHEAVPPIG